MNRLGLIYLNVFLGVVSILWKICKTLAKPLWSLIKIVLRKLSNAASQRV